MTDERDEDGGFSHWDHRVVRREYVEDAADGTEIDRFEEFTIAEVYYDASGEIRAWGDNPAYPSGDNVAELLSEIEGMRAALDKPILNYEDLPRYKDND